MKQLFLLSIISLAFIISCKKEETNPSITTKSAVPTSAISCTAKAKINEMGSAKVIDHGFIYYYSSSDYSQSSFNDNNKFSLGETIEKDTFSANFSISSSSYSSSSSYKCYIRAYITNEKGTVYGNPVTFSPLTLSLQGIYPSMARVGDTITILGYNLDPQIYNNSVQFSSNYYYSDNYNYSARVVEASPSQLKVIVPNMTLGSYGTAFNIKLTTGGQTYTLNNVFSFFAEAINYTPKTGTFNTYITITGSNLNSITSVFLGTTVLSSFSKSDNNITFSIPSYTSSKKFKIYLMQGNKKTEVPGGEFTMDKLTVTSFTPTASYAGGSITIYGSSFNTNYNSNIVFFGNRTVSVYYPQSSYLNVSIPNDLGVGNYSLKVSNGIDTVAVSGTLKIL